MSETFSPQTSDAAALVASTRRWGDTLFLWRFCQRVACARARACRGNVSDCFPRNFKLLPEDVQAWFEAIGHAQENGLSFDAAMEWLDEIGLNDAFGTWEETMKASLGTTKK